jgi:hypothetical protein
MVLGFAVDPAIRVLNRQMDGYHRVILAIRSTSAFIWRLPQVNSAEVFDDAIRDLGEHMSRIGDVVYKMLLSGIWWGRKQIDSISPTQPQAPCVVVGQC